MDKEICKFILEDTHNETWSSLIDINGKITRYLISNSGKYIMPNWKVTNEEWRPIVTKKGYMTNYVVSNYGRVKNRKTNELMSIYEDNGYYKTSLYINGKTKTPKIHRLVSIAFIPNPDNKPTINHLIVTRPKKFGTAINTVWELEWATPKEQFVDSFNLIPRGSKSFKSTISESIAHEICWLLTIGESLTDISNQLNVSYKIVLDIAEEKSWTHISSLPQYNIHAKRHRKPSNSKVDKFTLFKILELQEGGMSYSNIVKKINNVVGKSTIHAICTKPERYRKEKDEYEKIKLNDRERSTTIERDPNKYYIDIY